MMRTWTGTVAVLLLVLCALPAAAQQQPAESEEEKNARLARQGAGLGAGVWLVQDLERSGVEDSTWPLIEGWFSRGMDLHLALESSIGVWRREETETTSGGLGGGSSTATRTTYIVPVFTGLKFYPATTAGDRIEPYIGAAVGLAIGIQESSGSSGGLLGGGGGTTAETGLGGRATAGVELALGRVFSVGVGGGYQYIRFGNAVGGSDTYKGVRATAAVRYRFQY